MPRKPRIVETGDEGQDGQPVQAATKPEGVSDQEWAIGGVLGNLSLATALLDVTNGRRAPEDEHETASLMDAARKLEARSYKRYRTLRDGLGKKLADAKTENLDHVQMIQVLRDIEQYGPGHLNGQSAPSEICTQGVDETDQGSRDLVGDAALERIANDTNTGAYA